MDLILIGFSKENGSGTLWYHIDEDNKFLKINNMETSDCAITKYCSSTLIGTTAYLTGGFDNDQHKYPSRPASYSKKVFAFDLQGSQDWERKEDMLEGRVGHAMVVANNVIHAIGGLPEPKEKNTSTAAAETHIYSEYYSPGSTGWEGASSSYRSINKRNGWLPGAFISKSVYMPRFPISIVNNSGTFLYCPFTSCLFCYDPVKRSISSTSTPFGDYIVSFTSIDNVVYYLKKFEVGLFAFHINEDIHYPMTVKKGRSVDTNSLLPSYSDGNEEAATAQYLLAFGGKKLAIVWAVKDGDNRLFVRCNKFILKVIQNGRHEAKLVSIGRSHIQADDLSWCHAL